MMRTPFILAGVAAAAVFLGVNAYRKRNQRKNNTPGGLNIDNTGNDLPVNTGVSVSTAAVRPDPYSLDNIQPVHRFTLTEKLEARYPGFKNLELKNADKVAVEI